MAESFFKKPPSPPGKPVAPLPTNHPMRSQSPTPAADLPGHHHQDALLTCYRNLLYALATFVREQVKVARGVAEAVDPFGIFKNFKIVKAAAATSATAEATLLSEVQASLNRLASDTPWTSTEVIGLIANLRELQEKQFKSKPWLPHKLQVFELLPPAIRELEDFLSQIILSERDFDPRELASDFEHAVLRDASSLRDIQTSFERLKAKYHASSEAMTFLEIRFNLVIEALAQASEEVLDVLTKKCPQCAERPKTEAAVCRFCGYRFEQPSELEDREAAKLRAQQTAIAAFRQAAGTAIRQMAGVLEVSVATLSDQVKGELVNKARALAANQT